MPSAECYCKSALHLRGWLAAWGCGAAGTGAGGAVTLDARAAVGARSRGASRGAARAGVGGVVRSVTAVATPKGQRAPQQDLGAGLIGVAGGAFDGPAFMSTADGGVPGARLSQVGSNATNAPNNQSAPAPMPSAIGPSKSDYFSTASCVIVCSRFGLSALDVLVAVAVFATASTRAEETGGVDSTTLTPVASATASSSRARIFSSTCGAGLTT